MDFGQYKSATLNLVDGASRYLRELGEQDRATRIEVASKHLIEGQVLVVVAGEFKQGKSSLVNALLQTPGLVPVDIDVATSVVSLIRFGAEESYVVTLGEGDDSRKLSISRAELSEFATEEKNPGNRKLVQLIEIALPSKILKEGICLVDTPGIGGLYRAHSDLTYQFLPRADVVLYVSDSQQPLKSDDISFLKERVWPNCANVLYVVTRKDKNPDFKQIIASNQKKIADELKVSSLSVEIVAVSTPLKNDYIKGGDEQDLLESGYEELETVLWEKVIAKGGRILLERCLSTLEEQVSEVLEGVQLELTALQDTHERAEIEAELGRQKEGLQGLAESNAAWRTILNDGMADVRRDLQGEIQKELLALQVDAERMLHDSVFLSNPSGIGSRLKFALEALGSRVEQELMERAADIVRAIDVDSELGMTISSQAVVVKRNFVSFRLGDFHVRECNGWERMAKIGSGGYGRAAMLISASSLLGQAGFAFPPLLLLSLGAGLLAIGMKDSREQIDEQKRADLNKVIAKFFQEGQLNLSNNLMKSVSDVERSVRDELTDKINERRKGLEESLSKLNGHLKLSAEQARAKGQTLAQERATLTGILSRVRDARSSLASIPAPQRPDRFSNRDTAKQSSGPGSTKPSESHPGHRAEPPPRAPTDPRAAPTNVPVDIRTGPASWRIGEAILPVIVVGLNSDTDGVILVNIKETSVPVPLSQLEYGLDNEASRSGGRMVALGDDFD